MADKSASELAAEERKKIDVINTTKEDEVDEKDEKDEDEEEGDEKGDEKDEKNENEEKDDDEDEEKKKEKTAEELEAEKKAAKDQRTKDRIQKRIDKANAETKRLAAENADLKRKLDAKPEADQVLTKDDVKKLAHEEALQIAAERQFTIDCNKLADAAEKVDPKFQEKINILTEEIGNIPVEVIAILSDLNNGGGVLSYLSQVDNVEEAEEIWKLSPAKAALRLSKISIKLDQKPRKEISKVPDPIKPLGGNLTSGTKLHSKMSDKDWIEQRNREVAERNAAKRAGMR